jgi:phosphate transport system substrate-binding protein
MDETENRRKMRSVRSFTALALVSTLAFGAAACGSSDEDTSTTGSASAPSATTTAGGGAAGGGDLSGSIAGAGSSAQAAAQEAWTAGFQQANPGATISYDPVGSGGGREQFLAGGVEFAGSDAALDDSELPDAQKRCGGVDNVVELPVYVSPIAVIYNLPGVDELRLSPATTAKIFAQKIKSWNDPAIKADNPDVDLPDTAITPVNRSDESGTTENFTDWLSQAAASDWSYEVSGDWPVKGGEAAEGTSGVVDAVKNGEGTVGYADASQAGELGKAAIEVGSDYVEPSAEAAAEVFSESKRDERSGQNAFAYTINRQPTKAGVYPVVLVSYELACTQYDDANTAALVKGYLSSMVSPQGQQAAASNAGSAPLSQEVTDLITPAVEAIGAGA